MLRRVADLRRQVLIQARNCGLVALRLHMPVRVSGLADAGVTDLLLDLAEIDAV